MEPAAKKTRVYELARELDVSSRDLLRRARTLGVAVKNHMSTLSSADAERLRRAVRADRARTDSAAEAARSRRVLRRRARHAPEPAARPEREHPGRAGPARPPAEERPERREESPERPARQQGGPERPPREGAPASPDSAPSMQVPSDQAQNEQSARARFQRELEEARRRVEERERRQAEERAEREREKPGPRAPGRPAPGTVISLDRRGGRKRAARGEPARKPERASRPPARPARRPRPDQKRRPPRRERGPARKPEKTVPAEHKRVLRIEGGIQVAELAHGLGVKSAELLKKLWTLGMVGTTINSTLDAETAEIVAADYGYEIRDASFRESEVLAASPDDPAALRPRAPVVTVMGHVDHGKTTLLDTIRHERVASGEAGGITQHIAAYRARAADVGDVVFLDTPGHEAFTAMRARGARITDIVVLIVAADDGVMPQTLEALDHARAAGVPIVVAVNKVDVPDARPERVRQQLAERGLIPEEWGGDTQFVDVSAITGAGVDDLIASLAVQAELLELRANPDKSARGTVVEARIDRGRGTVATVLVLEGTLHSGDTVIAGEHMGRVRAMQGDRGDRVASAEPATPVEILGLNGVPDAGETLYVTDEITARRVTEHRRTSRRRAEEAARTTLSLHDVMSRLEERRESALKVLLKSDVHGSAEALEHALTGLSTEKVKLEVVRAGVGGITESDVNLARAGGALIVGFRVRPVGKAAELAAREGVTIKTYDVIYDVLEDVRRAMEGLLEPIAAERRLGSLEVREVFRIPRQGQVAGCAVTEGRIRRHAAARVVRDGTVVHDGDVRSLRRFKEDVGEVAQGYECGVTLSGFDDFEPGDVLEVYEIVYEAQTL